ncbi:MAG: type II toxin-antitoxin system VapC family toxin [Armatimonadetes bacterium]|nr:type II toxin-antitoxin system VapC family toxin [Armatimonadota bacterium]
MRVLLDTHVFLWWAVDDPRLSATARAVLLDKRNEVLLSAVTGWEIDIKAQLGKLSLADPPAAFVADQIQVHGFVVLPIQMDHVLRVFDLPHHHRDPFVRLLIAQSGVEGIPLLTGDVVFGRYAVDTIW